MNFNFSKRKIHLYLSDKIKLYANYNINLTVIDDLKKTIRDLLKGGKPLMSDIEEVVELMFCTGVLFQCCMKINKFRGLNTKNIIAKIADEIEKTLALIITRDNIK